MESTVENFFPLEILTEIFVYVDLESLVFRCRQVCRLWRDTVECPSSLWKIKIYHAHGHKFATDSALSKAHLDYPWYVCYALCRNVYNTIIFVRMKGNPLYWQDTDSPRHIWPTSFNASTIGFSAAPQGLLDEEDNECFLCCIGECSTNHKIDLYEQGLTRKIMELQPPIHIREWFTARFYYIGVCHIEVKLLNSEWQFNTQHGYFRSKRRIGRREWYKVSHTFTNYSPDVRYVVFHHGVDTCLPNFYGTLKHLDYGGAAAKMVGTKLSVALPDSSGPSTSRRSDS